MIREEDITGARIVKIEGAEYQEYGDIIRQLVVSEIVIEKNGKKYVIEPSLDGMCLIIREYENHENENILEGGLAILFS